MTILTKKMCDYKIVDEGFVVEDGSR